MKRSVGVAIGLGCNINPADMGNPGSLFQLTTTVHDRTVYNDWNLQIRT